MQNIKSIKQYPYPLLPLCAFYFAERGFWIKKSKKKKHDLPAEEKEKRLDFLLEYMHVI